MVWGLTSVAKPKKKLSHYPHVGLAVLPELAQMFSQLMSMELFSLQWDSFAVDV